MPRLRCPSCTKVLSVPASLSGKMGLCPHCKSKVRVPVLEPESSEPDDQITDEPPARASRRVQSEPAARPGRTRPDEDEEVENVEWEEVSPPERRRRGHEEDEDEYARPRRRRYEEDEDAPPRRRDEDEEERPRRRRRRRRRRESSGFWSDLSPMMKVMLIGVGASLALAGVAVAVPQLAIVPVILGWLLMFAGQILFLVVAFQDDVMQGILCLFVPCYSLFYLITHFEEEKVPFFMQIGGIGVTMIGSAAGVAGAALRGAAG
jgi:hypothetical protein